MAGSKGGVREGALFTAEVTWAAWLLLSSESTSIREGHSMGWTLAKPPPDKKEVVSAKNCSLGEDFQKWPMICRIVLRESFESMVSIGIYWSNYTHL